MITCESTVLEKLFHEDHPIGGAGTGIAAAWARAAGVEAQQSSRAASAIGLIELATNINLVNIRIECIPVRPTPTFCGVETSFLF
jgi:hypothetical protein